MNEILPQTNSEATLQKIYVAQNTLRDTLKEGFALIPLPWALTQECLIIASPASCYSPDRAQEFGVCHGLVSPYISNTSHIKSKDLNQTLVLVFPRCLWSPNTSSLPPPTCSINTYPVDLQCLMQKLPNCGYQALGMWLVLITRCCETHQILKAQYKKFLINTLKILRL